VIAGLSAAASHAAAPAPAVVVFVEPTLRHAAEDVGALFRARTGVPVRFFSAPSSMMIHEIPFTLCDLMILQGDAIMDEAIAHKVADGTTRTALGRNHLVLARSGPGLPATLAEVKADGPVAIVDAPVPDALGGLSHAALAGTDWPPPGVPVLGVATGADASYLLGTGEARLSVLYRTDVAADPNLSVAASLPDATPAPTYAAALSMSVNSPNTRAFLDFLTSPQARDKLGADGLEVTP
jgi:molybdate transport system substrate-binding protein